MTHEARIAAVIGAEVVSLAPLHGGDLSEVMRADLADGRQVVAKFGSLVAREARMLEAMARAKAPVPEVLALGEGCLCLTYIAGGTASADGWAGFGRALRAMHRMIGANYGWPEAYAFGHVHIDNRPCDSWPEFWAERRIAPLRAALSPGLQRRVGGLCARLDEMLPHAPDPVLLHGDLWTGNLHFDRRGCGWMIDPASYYGHGEVDLAMLHLFGTPPRRFTEAYGPLSPGWQARRAIYQLWPAMVHVALFGARYERMVAGLLDQLDA